MITDDQCDDEYSVDGHAHPKVTAKKTFFDLHRRRRRYSDVNASESETNFHPRIQWSAGTTNIGSGYQIGTYDNSEIRDIMKPVLRRESSRPDSASTFVVSESHLPPIPDTWGSMDAEPTQPEEIQHLLEPSPVIETIHIPEEVVNRKFKPKRKFMDNFGKRSAAAILEETNIRTRISEDEVQTINPEEEFKLLNERYIREGAILAKLSPEKDIAGFEPSSSHIRSDSKNVKKPNLKARRSHDQEIAIPRTSSGYEQPNGHNRSSVESDRKSLKRESFHEKRVTIDTDTIEYLSPESSKSPLPARRSCEPLDVKNLRKLRESDPEPGPSGMNQKDPEYPEQSSSQIINTSHATQKRKTSINQEFSDNVVLHSDSENSLKVTKEDACKIDSFKIDNPFSDFSLKNIDQEKNLLRKHTAETSLKITPKFQETAQPSTSNGAYAMEIYKQKNSRSESVEEPKKKSREQSFLQSAISRMKKASLDKSLMAKSSRRMIDAIATNLTSKGSSKEQKDHSGIHIENKFGVSFLHTILQQINERDFDSALLIGLKNDRNDFGRERMVFHCNDRNLNVLLTLLMEIIVNPTLNHFLKTFLPISSCRLFERSFDKTEIIERNDKWSDIIGFVRTAWPKPIDDVINVSPIRQKNMLRMYSETNEADAVYNLSKLLQGCDNETRIFDRPERNEKIQIISVKSNELVDEITQHVMNICFSQNLIREFLFLSFSRKLDALPNRQNFVSSTFSRLEYPWTLLTPNFSATPIVVFSNNNETSIVKKSDILEWFYFALIQSTIKKLHFTYI